jgi:DNA-binding FadR family transcriptional regulator
MTQVVRPVRGSRLPACRFLTTWTPMYVRLARKLRADIESGVLRRRDRIRAAGLSERYGVSEPVARAALSMLAANRYVHRPDRFHAYKVSDEWASGPAGA